MRGVMSYEVPMMFLEMIAHYYGSVGIDNDGDGLVDEDPWAIPTAMVFSMMMRLPVISCRIPRFQRRW